jgi:ribosomal protein S18 acetylase RimI-like enzyme
MTVAACEVQLVAIQSAERDEFMRIAEEHFRGLSSTFTPQDDWRRGYFETILANPLFFLRWIVCDGERAGFILYGIERHRFLPRTTGAIYELYVDPVKRRRGIAQQAARIAIRELQQQGPSKIQLEVVDGNDGAAALWTSLGFRKVTARFVLPAKL